MNFDQLYTDFSEKLLPKIQEGLVITKDYFIDFAGRYVKYLLVTDIFNLVLSIISFLVCIKFIFVGKRWLREDKYGGAGIPVIIFAAFFTLFAGGFIISYTQDLIKTIYVPELRIIEEIQYIKNN